MLPNTIQNDISTSLYQKEKLYCSGNWFVPAVLIAKKMEYYHFPRYIGCEESSKP